MDVTINGRSWRIAIDAAGEPGRFRVTLKGRQRVVDAVWIDPETISLIAVGAGERAPASMREVGVRDIGPGDVEVSLAGRAYRASVAAAGSRHARVAVRRPAGPEPASGSAAGPYTIAAPMPGRIVRVLVTAGTRVSAGQPVVIVEAMKMENELRAPRDGVVRAVSAIEGAAVEAGAALLVIE